MTHEMIKDKMYYILITITDKVLVLSKLWPDLIDILFPRSFPDPFQMVEKNKNKNKR